MAIDQSAAAHPTTIARLLRSATRFAWEPEHDVAFPDRPDMSVSSLLPDRHPFDGFVAYERLALEQQLAFTWKREAARAGGALVGESEAANMLLRLEQHLPTEEGRRYLASQVTEEQRHVRFFANYLTALGVEPPDALELRAFFRHLAAAATWDMQMLGLHVIVEGMGLVIFRELYRGSAVVPYRTGLRMLLRDEARHVGFGVVYLRDYFESLSLTEREGRADYALQLCQAMARSELRDVRLGIAAGFDPDAVSRHLQPRLEEHRRHLLQVIVPRVRRIGMLTNRTLRGYREAGLSQYLDDSTAVGSPEPNERTS